MAEASPFDTQDLTAAVVRALVLYALAEFQSGHATTIRVTVQGHSFTVADDGRGHAIGRTVGGIPYLKFVYTHLDYPFETAQSAPVQLHTIGISLINSLCAELTVTAHKHDLTLRRAYRNGQLDHDEVVPVESGSTGNLIAGTLGAHLQKHDINFSALRQWLLDVLAASPGLKLFLNGLALK